MKHCNGIYYSKIYWKLNMFRSARRSSWGALTVFAASCLYTHMVTGRCYIKPDGCVRFVQFSFGVLISVYFYCLFGVYKFNIQVTTWVYKPEAANTVWRCRVCKSVHHHTFKWINQLDAAINYRFIASRLTLSDFTSDLVRQYNFPVPLRCSEDVRHGFSCVCLPAVGTCPTLFLM
jgi:hypothetical protein